MTDEPASAGEDADEDARSAADDSTTADAGDATDGSVRIDDRDGASSATEPTRPTGDDPGTDSAPGATSSAGIDPDDIDPTELTVPQRSLHPRIRIIWVLKAVLTALFVGGIVWAADVYYLAVGPALPAGVFTAFLVLGVVHALLRYRVWNYEVREDALYLERGVVTRVRTVVPFVRIQHVDTSRGPIERATGLATSVVYTAGSRGADVAIPGLEADRAEDLQRRLKRLAIASEGDTAV